MQQTSRACIKELDLSQTEKILEKGGLLTDRHMSAVHQLLGIQFPDLQGLQCTLRSQTGDFQPVVESGFFAEGMLCKSE